MTFVVDDTVYIYEDGYLESLTKLEYEMWLRAVGGFMEIEVEFD